MKREIMGTCAECGELLSWFEDNKIGNKGIWNLWLESGYILPFLGYNIEGSYFGPRIELPDLKGKKMCERCYYALSVEKIGSNCIKCAHFSTEQQAKRAISESSPDEPPKPIFCQQLNIELNSKKMAKANLCPSYAENPADFYDSFYDYEEASIASPEEKTTVPAGSTKCPYCGSPCSINEALQKHLRDFDWACCANCGLILKATLDKTGKTLLAVDKYNSIIKLGFACSQRLNKAFPYSEPPIPENTCQELKKIMIGIKVNTCTPNPSNPSAKSFKDPTSQKWVLENLMPKITPILHDYPGQTSKIMESLGLNGLLEQYNTMCENCGLCIPKTRQNSCPFCLNEKNPPQP